jgi:hypothetical protein
VIAKLYDGRPKNEHDTFLQGLIELKPIQRRRPRSEESVKSTPTNFAYHVLKNSDRVLVCKQAFMSLHAISHIQVQRLTTLLAAGQSPKDLRGLHNNRPRAISDTIVLKIKEHIESFPLKTSHYSAKTKHYLDATLNVKTMHNLFVKKFPDMQHLLKYEFYLKYFNENYALKFGRPPVDVCSECERLGAKLKDKNLNDNAKRVVAAELMVRKRRAKKFYTKLKQIKQLCSERADMAAITFDYIQNLPLPHIPVQEIFYFRQLWVYAFEVHNIKDNTGHFYTYHEGQARKGPDEVCTFLNDYIKSHVSEDITELHIFCDGCPGQNRNNTMVRFLLALQATKRFKKIYHYFPARGHSFLTCDRDFGTLKRLVRKHDRVYIPEEYEEMMTSCRKNNPFTVKQITYKDIIDFKNWWPNSYKKNCSSTATGGNAGKDNFAISSYRQFVYDSSNPGYVTTYEYIDGLVSHSFKLLKQNKRSPSLPTGRAYKEPVPFNQNKVNDVKKVMQYITGEVLEFYYYVTSWKTTNSNLDDD